jgi:hypothetical protein
MSSCPSAVLNGYILNYIGDVLTSVGGRLQQFVDLFFPDELDGILFVAEKFANEVALQFVSLVFKPVDFDTEVQDGFLFVQCRESFSQNRARSGYHLSQEKYGRRNGLQPISNDPESGVFNTVEDVVERRGEGLNVFGIERSDEGGSQLAENIVHHVIPLVFDLADILLDPADAVIAVVEPADEELRGPAEDLGVALEQVKEVLGLRQ